MYGQQKASGNPLSSKSGLGFALAQQAIRQYMACGGGENGCFSFKIFVNKWFWYSRTDSFTEMSIPIPPRPNGYRIGLGNALIQTEVFVDIECPFSKRAWETLQR
ncbi:MAG: hypothetical protein HC886_14655 [Leptolyngbyaceae cyanobacterium SM1_1_3]|nr:hypothetical protein [Leptolyngbyaceae cyanobacterium SM1_1_3]